MIMEGCQGKPRTPTISEKICPNCGNPIEIFSTDTQVACDKCGFVVYNDTLSCVQWCKYARKCVGDEMYERMMEIARRQKEDAAAARKAKQEAQHEKGIGNGIGTGYVSGPCGLRRQWQQLYPRNNEGIYGYAGTCR